MPEHTWHTYRAARACAPCSTATSRRPSASPSEARRAGDRAEQPLAQQYYGIQMTQIRSMQGRAGELLPAVRELAEQLPGDSRLARRR